MAFKIIHSVLNVVWVLFYLLLLLFIYYCIYLVVFFKLWKVLSVALLLKMCYRNKCLALSLFFLNLVGKICLVMQDCPCDVCQLATRFWRVITWAEQAASRSVKKFLQLAAAPLVGWNKDDWGQLEDSAASHSTYSCEVKEPAAVVRPRMNNRTDQEFSSPTADQPPFSFQSLLTGFWFRLRKAFICF